MALDTATISFDLADLLGADFDPRRVRMWVTTNVESGIIIDTSAGDEQIWGASDGRSGADYLDVRVGETEYDDDTGTVVVAPANLAPRGYLAAMAEALST